MESNQEKRGNETSKSAVLVVKGVVLPREIIHILTLTKPSQNPIILTVDSARCGNHPAWPNTGLWDKVPQIRPRQTLLVAALEVLEISQPIY